MSLLKSYLSNVKALKKLTEANANNTPLKYVELNLTSKLYFGEHPTLLECALKCDATIKEKLKVVSLELQRDAQSSREEANAELLKQLKNCKENFANFGRDEWVKPVP